MKSPVNWVKFYLTRIWKLVTVKSDEYCPEMENIETRLSQYGILFYTCEVARNKIATLADATVYSWKMSSSSEET